MSALRGFGTQFDFTTGSVRNFYFGTDGIKRWVHNDAPVDLPELTPAQLAEGDATEERR